MPDVTVVIPTRNRRNLLGLTLGSVLAQQDVDLECVVVDDASTDGTAALVGSIADERVRHVRHDRCRGVSVARNHGAQQARSDWVAFLDDDDLWAPDKLSAQLLAAQRQATRWAYAGAVGVDASLRMVSGYRPLPPEDLCRVLPYRNPVPAGSSNVLLRRDLWQEVGGFDARLRHLGDWDLWARLAGRDHPACVDRPLVAYRLHGGNASLDTPGILEEARAIEGRLGHRIDWAALHAWMGWSHLRAGRRRQASVAYLRAARNGHRVAWLRAVNALVHPGAGRRLFYRPFAPDDDLRDPQWAAPALSWLPVQEAPG